jgi:hypothetical protein
MKHVETFKKPRIGHSCAFAILDKILTINYPRERSLFMTGVEPKRNVFPGKNFADRTIKNSKTFYPTSNISKKINAHPWPKTLQNGIFSCHTCPLPHFCDTSLIIHACAIVLSCNCTCMYFLWRQHLSPDKSENDQDSDADWFIYCIDICMTVDIHAF